MKHIPGSTYRLQFTKDFGFRAAISILEYLNKLGITDIYASPIWQARKGSMHGYDVVEPSAINPELGSEGDFKDFTQMIKLYKFGWLQDIVPNHMAFSGENQMLVDVLENRENSRYFNFFDIEWNHPRTSMGQRLLAPFLGKLYDQALESGEIQLKYDQSGFSVNYYETRLPIKMESYSYILSFGMGKLVSTLGRKDPDVIKYLGVVYFLRSLPSAEDIDERYYQIMFEKNILWELYTNNEIIKITIDKTLEALNGVPGDQASFDNLDKILTEQNFRLSYWKVAVEEINYRRFFNISELISLRIEIEEVFKRTHRLILKLVSENEISGLRVDHVDGLYNPSAYLKRLNEEFPEAYIIAEKILDAEENLPVSWPIEGTTGYEFINFLNALFVKMSSERRMSTIYQRFSRNVQGPKDIGYDKKRLIIKARMAGDVERLALLIETISSRDRAGIDITMHGLKGALEEILTYFPVYRTYISRNDYSEQDKIFVDNVINRGLHENPRFSNEINYIGHILKMEFPDHASDQLREQALDFVMKFQQLTGPIMAKGFEDTALYVYNRLISLNEVGGDPSRFGIDTVKYHQFILQRFENWPYTMNASSTHDTKRGEDTRARINVLSEIPDEWELKVRHWNIMNKKFKRIVKRVNTPDRNDEYFLYQNMIGAFPFEYSELDSFKERLKEYTIKAVREAKVHTAWIKPDEIYENTFMDFIDSILAPGSDFLEDFLPFAAKISFYGIYNSMVQTIFKILSPGVPDIYQGSELWNFSLVDPDNRRHVDYDQRAALLEEIISLPQDIKTLIADPNSGKIKLYLIYKLLKERNDNPDLYLKGKYIPLYADGLRAENIIGFMRKSETRCSVVICGRFFTSLVQYPGRTSENIWNGTFIKLPAGGNFRNIFTDHIIDAEHADLNELFTDIPFAVLVNES